MALRGPHLRESKILFSSQTWETRHGLRGCRRPDSFLWAAFTHMATKATGQESDK